MNRKEHLEWCKQRAIEYLNEGDIKTAWGSMCYDLQKHEETREHPAIMLGMMMVMSNQLSTTKEMKDFILGFN